MGGVLLGFALGAMAFTSQGRELADKLTAAAAIDGAKRAVKNATKSAEQLTGAAGDDRHLG